MSIGRSRFRQKILIIGGDSRIGKACAQRLKADCDVWLTSRSSHLLAESQNKIPFDLLQPSEQVLALKPDCVLFCAAVTSTQICTEQPEYTRKINVDAPIELAGHYASKGAQFVFFSTNEVFDGSTPHIVQTSPYSPKIVYGAQKAEVDKFLQTHIHNSIIIRMSKVVAGGEPLWSNWIRSLRSGNPIQPFKDRYISPVLVDAVSTVVMQACRMRAIGTLQLSGERDVSYAELALQVARKLGVSEGLVAPVAAGSMIGSVHNPRYTSLDSRRAEAEFGFRPSTLDSVAGAIINVNSGALG